jgi:DNA polymerase III alpha subunit
MGPNVIPQLRVRTEFTFRAVYGPVRKVAATLRELGAPAAGIVDGDTWGHVRWAKACAAEGVRPLFGREFAVRMEDGRRPTFWALAERGRLGDFYRASSLACVEPENGACTVLTRFPGVVFAGAALKDPGLFDYVDLNPASPMQQRAAIRLARSTGRPLVLTSDNAYPAKSHYPAFMAIAAREKVTPQHLLSIEELRAQFTMLDDGEFAAAVRNTHEAAERCETTLNKASIISVPGDIDALVREGIEYRLRRGHIEAWTPEHQARLERELTLIREKRYESYFLVVAELITWAKRHMLVGPGRGSSAGSLVCYLLRITEVNPLKHGLLFERFIDVTRNDLPDIDIDFNDEKREDCFTHLAEVYGRGNVARIGNVATLKPLSAMAEVGKRLGIAPHEMQGLRNSLIVYSSGDSRFGSALEDTLTQTEPGRDFMRRHPAARVLWDVENHAWHTGVHAAGVIVANDDVGSYCTVGPDGVAHIDKYDAEHLGLLKIDALGLRTLGVIEDAGVVDNETLYDIAQKLDDPEVIGVFNSGKFAGIFQFEGQAMRWVCQNVRVDSFRQVDHITALARPGPLGGGAAAKYFARSAGTEPVAYEHPAMEACVSGTLGVILYQEQVMRIGAEVGKLSWGEVTLMRKAMSGRKGSEFFDQLRAKFIEGATTQTGMTVEVAEHVWSEINTFGAWGMNASHTVSYAIVSYWCAWMKRYHHVEYAAACLRNAKNEAQAIDLLRELTTEGVRYVPFDAERSDVNWRAVDGELVGGYLNLKGYGPKKAAAAIARRSQGTTTPAAAAKLAAAAVKFSELYPLRARWHEYYEDPEAMGCRVGSVISPGDKMPEEGSVLYLCKITGKRMRDENESMLIARRNGRRTRNPTTFLDMAATDDTGVPFILRIDRFAYEPLGRLAWAGLVVDEDVLLVRGVRLRGYPMIKVTRLRCLTNPKALEEQRDE